MLRLAGEIADGVVLWAWPTTSATWSVPEVAAQKAAISDRVIASLSAIGDVPAGIARYRAAGATNPLVSPVRGTDVTTTLRAAAGTD
jgi:hypothetical protein